jgi:SurA N-terminal domain/PPIC-type PPIASE domain
MRKSYLVITLAVTAAVLAGCGGGGSSAKLSTGDVAVVGGKEIPKTDFDALMQQAALSYKQQGKAFPQQGTTDYETIKGEAVTLLVEQAEREQKAAKMGITVSDAAVTKRLQQIKKLPTFGGSEKKFDAALKKQHLTLAQLREDIRAELISDAVYAKVTNSVTVPDKSVQAYYEAHLSQYQQPASRDVRYILVGKSKSLAQSVYKQLEKGNDQTWCKLAKKYAKDASGQNCGKATFTKGETVPIFDKTAFSAPTKKVVPPFYDPTQYKAWFVIEPLSPVKKSVVTPEKQVAASIRQTLLTQAKNQAMTAWVSGLKKDFCGGSQIKYQVGYSPSPDPCASTSTTTTAATG